MKLVKFSLIFSIVLLFFTSYNSLAQDITVYRSPLSVDSTINKIKSSILKNKFKYLEIQEFQSVYDSASVFKGLVKIVHFETPEIYKLAACEPSAMIDMPLKIIIWSEDNDTYFGYMNANTYSKRFMVRNCVDVIRKINIAYIRVSNDVIRTH